MKLKVRKMQAHCTGFSYFNGQKSDLKLIQTYTRGKKVRPNGN